MTKKNETAITAETIPGNGKSEHDDLAELARALEEIETPAEPIENKTDEVEEEEFDNFIANASFEDFRREILDVLSGIDERFERIEARLKTIESRVSDLADFKENAIQAVQSTAESTTVEIFENQINKIWVPKIDKILDKVEKSEKSNSEDMAVVKEVRLGMPQFRRVIANSDLMTKIERGEKVIQLLDTKISQLKSATPTAPTKSSLLGS